MKMKKFYIVLFAFVANFSFVHAAVVDGTCGENLTWSLDTDTRILEIEGCGNMNNYSQSPWSDYKNHISKVILPQGITSIGNYAFGNLSISSVNMPDSITSIGKFAFTNNYYMSLDTLKLPEQLSTLGHGAFGHCWSIKSVIFPNKLRQVSGNAFVRCENLNSIVLGDSVESIGNDAFKDCPIKRVTITTPIPPASVSGCGIDPFSCILFVPDESKELYENADWWKYFKEIKSIGSYKVVKFVDWDGRILSTQELEIGSAATPPASPTREGYTFIGWDKDFSNVTEDMTIIALYKINRYKVDFVDWDNTILKSDSVDWNTAAVPPSEPYRKGYTFKGWDKEFEHVTYNLTIKAQYEMGEDTDIVVKFTNGNNGNEILRHSVTLKVPEAPEIEGFSFLGWQPISKFIEEEIEIQAIYKSDTEAVPDVYTNPSNPSQKLIREGNVYILHGEKVYTVTGQEVR